ncbi:MAG TPA: hypothetical protein VIJ27_02990, partial [Mucilaginibacter sp.]
ISRHTGKSNWIIIKLGISEQQLDVFIANSTSPGESTQVVNYGGIGLKNVQRRLDLIYPGQYELNIQNHDDRFEVRLKVMLAELVL